MTTAKSVKLSSPMPPDVDPDAKCLFCGEPFNAMWHGSEGVLYICTACAVEVLPRVIADAVVDKGSRGIAGAETAWKTSEHYFRRTMIKHGVQVAHSALPLGE